MEIIESMAIEVPFITRILMDLSFSLNDYPLILIILAPLWIISLFYGHRALANVDSANMHMQNFTLNLLSLRVLVAVLLTPMYYTAIMTPLIRALFGCCY